MKMRTLGLALLLAAGCAPDWEVITPRGRPVADGKKASPRRLTKKKKPPPPRPGPKVTITSPAAGWSSERIVRIAGTIADTALSRATLVVNGIPKGLTVSAGRFDTKVALSPGPNVLQVVATAGGGVGVGSVEVYSRVPAKDVKVVMSWDTDGTDIDLHVVEPSGEETYYGHRRSKIGGYLDQDVTSGYGPETYTLASAPAGTYQIRAKYYSDNGQPQTFVRVDVVLHEGTAREERLTFRGVLEKTGSVVPIASFSLPR